MAHYRTVGDVPLKRHTRFDNGRGGFFYEELMGEEGFSSDSALLYHRHIPSALASAQEWVLPDQALVPNTPLLPRHYRLPELCAAVGLAQLERLDEFVAYRTKWAMEYERIIKQVPWLVPQSNVVTTTFCATSASLRVR